MMMAVLGADDAHGLQNALLPGGCGVGAQHIAGSLLLQPHRGGMWLGARRAIGFQAWKPFRASFGVNHMVIMAFPLPFMVIHGIFPCFPSVPEPLAVRNRGDFGLLEVSRRS